MNLRVPNFAQSSCLPGTAMIVSLQFTSCLFFIFIYIAMSLNTSLWKKSPAFMASSTRVARQRLHLNYSSAAGDRRLEGPNAQVDHKNVQRGMALSPSPHLVTHPRLLNGYSTDVSCKSNWQYLQTLRTFITSCLIP